MMTQNKMKKTMIEINKVICRLHCSQWTQQGQRSYKQQGGGLPVNVTSNDLTPECSSPTVMDVGWETWLYSEWCSVIQKITIMIDNDSNDCDVMTSPDNFTQMLFLQCMRLWSVEKIIKLAGYHVLYWNVELLYGTFVSVVFEIQVNEICLKILYSQSSLTLRLIYGFIYICNHARHTHWLQSW